MTVRDSGRARRSPPATRDGGRGIELMRALTDDVTPRSSSRRGGVAALRHRIRVRAPLDPPRRPGTQAA